MVNVSKEGQIFKCEICGNVVANPWYWRRKLW